MILFETLFALLYAFIWEQRLPTGLEGAAIVLLVAGVLSCTAAHRSESTVPA
jgi:drug/metabolite transporter (DMT)-like permease